MNGCRQKAEKDKNIKKCVFFRKTKINTHFFYVFLPFHREIENLTYVYALKHSIMQKLPAFYAKLTIWAIKKCV